MQKKYQYGHANCGSVHEIQNNHRKFAINNPEQVQSTKLLRRTTEAVTKNFKDKGVSPIYSQKGEQLSKFYVKNIFTLDSQSDAVNIRTNKVKNQQNRNINFEEEKNKKDEMNLAELKIMSLQYSKSANTLKSPLQTKRAIVQMTNDSINTCDKEHEQQIKQLKRQLLQSEIARQDLMVQNRQMKEVLRLVYRQKQKQNEKIKLQNLNQQNLQIKKQLKLIKLALTQKNPRTQLARALLYIEKLEHQIQATKSELNHTFQSINILKKRYQAEQHSKLTKTHKIQEITKKYKDLISRVHELKNQAIQQQQQTNLENYFSIDENQKKVFVARS